MVGLKSIYCNEWGRVHKLRRVLFNIGASQRISPRCISTLIRRVAK